MNQKTSFLDLSQVYGASEQDLENLIHSDKMHLKTRRGKSIVRISLLIVALSPGPLCP